MIHVYHSYSSMQDIENQIPIHYRPLKIRHSVIHLLQPPRIIFKPHRSSLPKNLVRFSSIRSLAKHSTMTNYRLRIPNPTIRN